MWIPDSIYKKLPALYVLAGAALIPLFGLSTPSAVSAGLLVGAGVLTALWRYQHRVEDEEPEADPTTILKEQWAERRERRLEAMRNLGQ